MGQSKTLPSINWLAQRYIQSQQPKGGSASPDPPCSNPQAHGRGRRWLLAALDMNPRGRLAKGRLNFPSPRANVCLRAAGCLSVHPSASAGATCVVGERVGGSWRPEPGAIPAPQLLLLLPLLLPGQQALQLLLVLERVPAVVAADPGAVLPGQSQKRLSGSAGAETPPTRELGFAPAPVESSELSGGNARCIPATTEAGGSPSKHKDPSFTGAHVPRNMITSYKRCDGFPPAERSPHPRPSTDGPSELAAPSASHASCSRDSSFIYFSLPRSCCFSLCAQIPVRKAFPRFLPAVAVRGQAALVATSCTAKSALAR